MNRNRRRISRALIGILVVTIVLGLVSYFHKTDDTRARELAASPPADPSTSPLVLNTILPPQLSQGGVLLTITPTTQPQQPSQMPPPPIRDNAVPEPKNDPPSQSKIQNPKSKIDFPLPLAQSHMDAGRLLQARDILNEALSANQLADVDADTARRMLMQINQTIVFSPRRFADDPLGGSYSVKPGDSLNKIAPQYNMTWELLGRLNGLSDPRKLRAGQTLKVIQGPFHAVVDKSKFTIDLYLGSPAEEGSMYITSFPVGLGADDSTPTGVWMVEPGKKLKNPTYFSPRGEGIMDSSDPDNPLGERWIGLSGIDGHAVGKDSYGIHGTIEPDSIGKQQSMGCIRLRNEDVELLYEMLLEGKSTVTVK